MLYRLSAARLGRVSPPPDPSSNFDETPDKLGNMHFARATGKENTVTAARGNIWCPITPQAHPRLFTNIGHRTEKRRMGPWCRLYASTHVHEADRATMNSATATTTTSNCSCSRCCDGLLKQDRKVPSPQSPLPCKHI